MKLVDVGFWKVFSFVFVDGKLFIWVDFDFGLCKVVIFVMLVCWFYGDNVLVGCIFVFDLDEY